MPAIDYLSAIANQLNQRRMQQQGQGDALQQMLMKAKIESQTQQLDPGNILSQLELMNIVKQLGGGGQLPQQGGQPIGQMPRLGVPQGQAQPQGQGIQLGQPPQIQAPQTPPVQRTQPNIGGLGQPQPQSLQLGQPPLQVSPFTKVSDQSTGKYGQPEVSTRTVANPEYAPIKAQKIAEGEAVSKSKGAERMTLINLGKLGGQVNELSEIYAGAIKEGGFGNILKKKISEVRLGVGGKQADKFKQTAAYSGVLTEVIAAIMPTLTQQGDEKGSVRLVESVFRKIRESFPEGHQYAGTAQNMIRTSLRNAYRKAKIINEMALSNEYIDNLPNKDLETLADKINKMADNIQIKKGSQEDKAVNNFINQSTQPLLRILKEDASMEGQQQRFKPGFVNKSQAPKQSAQSVQEGSIANNPQTGERIQFKNGRWIPIK